MHVSSSIESKECTDNESVEHPPIADHIMVLLIRGLFFKLNFPYAHFPTRKGIVADMLFPIVWEAIRQLEAQWRIQEKGSIEREARAVKPVRNMLRLHPLPVH